MGIGTTVILGLAHAETQRISSENEARNLALQAQNIKTERSSGKVNEEFSRIQEMRKLDDVRRAKLVSSAASGFSSNSQSTNNMNNYDLSLAMQQDKVAGISTASRDTQANTTYSQYSNQSDFTRSMGRRAESLGVLSAFGGLLGHAGI